MSEKVIEWVKTIVISVIIALVITTFIRPTLVMEYSMYPTIEQYDYLMINKVAYKLGEPKFGDIVVFTSELLRENGEKKQLIKRVIGIPGDTIEIKDGITYRNGEVLDEPYINGGVTSGALEPTTIKEGELFVMGDNRPNSIDSRREDVGMVPIDTVVGKVMIRLYPFNKIGFVE
ncbi:MAG: signal peptidase I [Clostridia bacterium]|nr:signal peptidase I [Clostridia bacterium]